MMTKKKRLDKYISDLNETLRKESQQPNDNDSFLDNEITSPHSAMCDEELRIFMPYMRQRNAFLVTKQIPTKRKNLMLRLFLRSKRNQTVEVKGNWGQQQANKPITGKVSAIGRDFVMLTTLKDKYWLPYTCIESANLPSGVPDYANNYQHVLYDNHLRKKLVTNFAETVGKKDALIQQFYEETLQSNLSRWVSSLVAITSIKNEVIVGKLIDVKQNFVVVRAKQNDVEVCIDDITFIKTISFFKYVSSFFH
jgi:hypothetical protein